VPLAIVGTFALIYVFGYSLDNLSLMALTIAVGFVVDDAIVMIENIERHVEAGLAPMEAAAKGAGEIAFTIVSISLSLIAVFIPLLLMGGVVGRLFREFAVTVTITILVSALVSLSLSPMMCSRLLHDARHVRHGRLYMLSGRGFDLLLAGYRKSLDVALRHQPATLAIFLAAVVATGYLFVTIPKGFFPQQDTGLIIGVSEAAQDVSFAEMANRARALSAVVSKDPAVASVAMNIGAGPAQTQNMGYGVITLKPRRQRDASADDVIKRLRPQLAKVEGAVLFMQAAQDINIGGRLARTQYQYTLLDADLSELTRWAPKILSALKQLSELRDVASDQQSLAGTLTLTIDRDQAARFGIQPQLIDDALHDAFGQRHVTQYYTQLNSYWVIMEVLPEMQNSPDTLDNIYVNSPSTGKPIRLSNLVKWTQQPTAFLSINHQNLFPAVTLSFNLASGVALGQAVEAIKRAQARIAVPASLIGSFQGNAQAFRASLASEPYLVAIAIIVIYIILGVLYESYIHPLTILSTLPSAGLGALLTLIVFGFDFSLIALIGIILLIGIVKKNGIMLVDFAIEEQRSHGLAPVEAIRKACLLRFRPIMMTTTAAILGGVPLMIGTGAGTEIRQPLGFAVVGGLIVNQALTLYTTPVVFLYLDHLNTWLAGGLRTGIARRVERPLTPQPFGSVHRYAAD
jgi:multidrug efflux pump subunit AcrB